MAVAASPTAAPAPQARPITLAQTAIDAETNGTAVKGSLVLCALEFFDQLETPATDLVLTRLPPDVRARVEGVRMPMAWLSLEDFAAVISTAEREIGSKDGALAVRLGRFIGEREMSTTHRLFMKTATPAMAIERLPRLFRTYHSHGEIDVDPHNHGGYKLVTAGLEPDSLSHALLVSGFCQRMLEMAGARDVRASVVACRGRGDETTVTAIRWK